MTVLFNFFHDTNLPPVIVLSQLGHKQIPAHRKKAIILNVIYFTLKNELLHYMKQTCSSVGKVHFLHELVQFIVHKF